MTHAILNAHRFLTAAMAVVALLGWACTPTPCIHLQHAMRIAAKRLPEPQQIATGCSQGSSNWL